MAIAMGRETDSRALARNLVVPARRAVAAGVRSAAWLSLERGERVGDEPDISERGATDVHLRSAGHRRAGVFSDFAPECASTLEGMPASALSLGAWLDALRGEVPLNALAQATGFSRHQLGRWSRGVARTTLPEFLLLVQVCSGRLDQLLSNLLPPPQNRGSTS
jgi:hypothetical protein